MKKIKTLLCLGLLGALVYSIVQLSIPFYRHYALEQDLKDIVTYDFKQEELSGLVYKRVEESGIPVTRDEVKITFTGGRASVSIRWTETVNFLNVYSKVFEFNIDVSGL